MVNGKGINERLKYMIIYNQNNNLIKSQFPQHDYYICYFIVGFFNYMFVDTICYYPILLVVVLSPEKSTYFWDYTINYIT